MVIEIIASYFPYGMKMMSKNTLSEPQPDSASYPILTKILKWFECFVLSEEPGRQGRTSVSHVGTSVLSSHSFEQLQLQLHSLDSVLPVTASQRPPGRGDKCGHQYLSVFDCTEQSSGHLVHHQKSGSKQKHSTWNIQISWRNANWNSTFPLS